MPYMIQDPNIAIIQTPQFFRWLSQQNWLEKAGGSTQELFYRLVQVSRNRFGGSICVGTSAIYRRKSMEPFGGTAAIEHSEDVNTGFNVLSSGWKVVYMPIILSMGICPDTVKAYFN